MEEYVDIEMSKKLVESGMPQEAEKWWVEFHGGYAIGHADYDKNARWVMREDPSSLNFKPRYPAYTLGQLLEALPDNSTIYKRPLSDSYAWECCFDKGWNKSKKYEYGEKLINVLVEMILYIRSIGYVWDGGKLVKGTKV